MRIRVKELQGDEYDFDVDTSQRVLELKSLISGRAIGLAIEKQKLVFKGRTMQDARLLSDYNLEEGCKVHLIVPKETSPSGPHSSPSRVPASMPTSTSANVTPTTGACAGTNLDTLSARREVREFELILKERLAQFFANEDVNKIVGNLQKEIDVDVNSSSLDDLERLAKQKLKISNE